jgi:hypothetical protein
LKYLEPKDGTHHRSIDSTMSEGTRVHHSELQVIQVIAKHDGPSFGKKATRTDKKKLRPTVQSFIMLHSGKGHQKCYHTPVGQRVISIVAPCGTLSQ